jgi:hypothetical protein
VTAVTIGRQVKNKEKKQNKNNIVDAYVIVGCPSLKRIINNKRKDYGLLGIFPLHLFLYRTLVASVSRVLCCCCWAYAQRRRTKERTTNSCLSILPALTRLFG